MRALSTGGCNTRPSLLAYRQHRWATEPIFLFKNLHFCFIEGFLIFILKRSILVCAEFVWSEGS
jgi:hypothetical protein